MLKGFASLKEELIYLLDKSKTAYHTTENVANILTEHGYNEIFEYNLNPDLLNSLKDKKYFIRRNDSSLIAFRIDSNERKFNIVATHSDSPALLVKPNGYAEFKYDKNIATIDVSGYGSGIWHTWFDRPLKLCGRRVEVMENGYIKINLFEDSGIGRIPSTAIHMERNINDGKKINVQNDMKVCINVDNSLKEVINNSDGFDLYFVSDEKPTIYGDTICSPRIDNLASVYSALDAFLGSMPSYGVSMFAMFDNEEIGSRTYQGAFSNFIENVIYAICGGENFSREKSFIISFDGAHATPINNSSLFDTINPVCLGNGIVIKYHENYCTDGVTAAKFKKICKNADEPYQTYTCRSDMKCGGTIGTILTSKLGMPGVDVGIPMHGMHSISETANYRDWLSSNSILRTFYSEL